jgi:SAM-dependent methyltransferase
MKKSLYPQQLKSKILFYTSATKFYENFVTPYIFFAATHNLNSTFEFIVDDISLFRSRHQPALDWLTENLNIVIHLQDTQGLLNRPHKENSIRFIIEPKMEAEFVYIGDVDIMIMEDIASWHSPIFEAALPYSNIIRSGTKRLSGLHFTRYKSHYPLPEIADLINSEINDEELLYKIVERKGLLYPNEKFYSIKNNRPIHGLHMSLNRLPFSYNKERVGWGMSYAHLAGAESIFKSDIFNDFFATLYAGSAQVLTNLIYLSRGVCAYGPEYFQRVTTLSERTVVRNPTKLKTEINYERFTEIYKKNSWRNLESRSGPSSTLARTEQIRKQLPSLLIKHSINSMLDAPCGDLNWMSTLLQQGIVKTYVGADIVDDIVLQNKKKYVGLANSKFLVLDITKDNLPSSDLLLCRDCLFHFSYADLRRFLTNFAESEIPFLLTTTHYNLTGFINKDITTGGWRWFDLFQKPLFFPPPVDRISDGPDRELCLFTKQQIKDLLLKWKIDGIGNVD